MYSHTGSIENLVQLYLLLYSTEYSTRVWDRIPATPPFAGLSVAQMHKYYSTSVPAEGAHADLGDVAQARRRRRPLDAEEVVYRLAVCPDLHLARRGEHANAHVGAGPDEACVGRLGGQGRAKAAERLMPAAEQLRPGQAAQPLVRFLEAGQALGAPGADVGHQRAEGLRVGRRGEGHVIAHVQMAHDVVRRPGLEQGRARPVGTIQRLQQAMQFVGFVA